MKNILRMTLDRLAPAFPRSLRRLNRVVGEIVDLVALGKGELAMVFRRMDRWALVNVNADTQVSVGATPLTADDLWKYLGADSTVAYCRRDVPGRREGEPLLAHSVEVAAERHGREA